MIRWIVGGITSLVRDDRDPRFLSSRWEQRMPTRRIGHTLLIVWPIAVLSSILLAGCGDDSRTTGTQVKISEEAKAQINDMRDMYKSEKSARKPKK